ARGRAQKCPRNTRMTGLSRAMRDAVPAWGSENVLAHVLGVRVRAELGVYIIGVDADADFGGVAAAGVEGDVVEYALHQRVQAARADVFRRLIGLPRAFGDGLERAGLEIEAHAVHAQEK